MVRHNLSYDVYKIEENRKYKIYCFESSSLPDHVRDYSLNNPDKVL